jgi:hypothetical protein
MVTQDDPFAVLEARLRVTFPRLERRWTTSDDGVTYLAYVDPAASLCLCIMPDHTNWSAMDYSEDGIGEVLVVAPTAEICVARLAARYPVAASMEPPPGV